MEQFKTFDEVPRRDVTHSYLGRISGRLLTLEQRQTYLRQVRPANAPGFEVHFAGESMERKVWLFAMALGHSRYLWAQFVMHQDLPTVLHCHM